MALKDMVAAIIEDGIVDGEEILTIKKEAYEDGVIDKDEMDAMFAINNAVTDNENDVRWPLTFAMIIADGVLADDVSPQEIDDEEAAYLIQKIGEDGKVDEAERLLLKIIMAAASKVSQRLLDYAKKAGV